MKTTFKSMRVGMPRLVLGCAMACAVTLLPIGVADAKPANKKAVAEKAAADRKRAQQVYTKKIELWGKKLKTAVKDGIISEKEAKSKMISFKKKLATEKQAVAKKKAAAKKAADKKKAESKKPKKKAEPKKKKPAPVTVAEYTKKMREMIKAGKLTKKEAKAKVAAYKKNMGETKKK